MFRRPIRAGRPGLLGTVARTAVVAGTATVVSNAVTGHQREKQAEKLQEQAAEQSAFDTQSQLAQLQGQVAAMQAQPTPDVQAPPATADAPAQDFMAQLQQLAQLHSAGALSDAEFQAAKTKLLG